MPIMTIRIEASIGPKNIVVVNIIKNSPPATAARALPESSACFFEIQFLTRALVLVFAERYMASHDRGIVKATLIRVAFITPKSLVVASSDPSVKASPNTVNKMPANQYNFLFLSMPAISCLRLSQMPPR